MSYLIPGELIPEDGFIELNKGREITTLKVANTSDRPIQENPSIDTKCP